MSMRKYLLRYVVVLMFLATAAQADAPLVGWSQEQVRLNDGNERFASDASEHPRSNSARREDTFKNGQKPMATILTCSDSRIPVERVFDQGVGDLFVIRVAGNIAGESETASIEYGVEHLGTPLLVVMGHRGCGAVAATAQNAEVHGHLPALIERIKPAVESVKAKEKDLHGPALVAAAVTANVRQSMADLLKGSSIIRERIEKYKLTMIGAVYDLETGKVEWLGPHPQQSALMGEGGGKAHHPAPAKEKSGGH